MIESSRMRVSVVLASPVSLEADWVSTLHTLISSGALAATTKDPMASIAKGIWRAMHACQSFMRLTILCLSIQTRIIISS